MLSLSLPDNAKLLERARVFYTWVYDLKVDSTWEQIKEKEATSIVQSYFPSVDDFKRGILSPILENVSLGVLEGKRSLVEAVSSLLINKVFTSEDTALRIMCFILTLDQNDVTKNYTTKTTKSSKTTKRAV